MMPRLRESETDFVSAIDSAATKLGLAPIFVEKDYWVTQVLRILHEQYPGAFVFKGGTSLSKGYGLIDRFSEDVDILVQPAKGDSAKTREARLRAMTEGVAADLGVDWIEKRPPGRGKMPHRADVLAHQTVVTSSVSAPFEDRGVLLETGFAGGDSPGEMVDLEPMLCAPLGLDPHEYQDTAPFSVRALKPERTLLEKVSLLHHVATGFAENATVADERCGRHYYDVFRLLDHPPTRTALDDREQFEITLLDMQVISARYYGGWTERPPEGYAASAAFAPPADSELREWLEQRYQDAADLLPAATAGRWPSFGQVLQRVGQHAKLL